MPIEKIYIARHGFRLNWITQTWTSPTGLARDPPLAAYGEAQAEEMAAYFEGLSPEERPQVIFSSGFYRCLQTATPTAKKLGIPLYVEHGIGEWFSPAAPGTGLHPRPGSASSLSKFFPHIDTSYSSTYLPSRMGETVSGVHTRTREFLSAWLEREDVNAMPLGIGGEEEGLKRVLLVGHAASVITLVKELSGEREMPIRVGCCSVTTLVPKVQKDSTNVNGERNAKVGEWKVISKTDASFLKNGVERDWGFEDIEVEKGEVVNDAGMVGTEGQVEKEDEWGLQVGKHTEVGTPRM